MIYLGILIGFILGIAIGFIKWKKKLVVEKYQRRGLLEKEFTTTNEYTNKKRTVEVVYEIGELESTDKLSKVEVISIISNQSEYNTDYNKKRLLEMVDKTWVNSIDDFDKLPHIKYIDEIQSKSEEERTLYYLGGEPEENDTRLTVGKLYEIRSVSYSPSSDLERVSVWVCFGDKNEGEPISNMFADIHVFIINKINFGTFADIRDRKIDKILRNGI